MFERGVRFKLGAELPAQVSMIQMLMSKIEES